MAETSTIPWSPAAMLEERWRVRCWLAAILTTGLAGFGLLVAGQGPVAFCGFVLMVCGLCLFWWRGDVLIRVLSGQGEADAGQLRAISGLLEARKQDAILDAVRMMLAGADNLTQRSASVLPSALIDDNTRREREAEMERLRDLTKPT